MKTVFDLDSRLFSKQHALYHEELVLISNTLICSIEPERHVLAA